MKFLHEVKSRLQLGAKALMKGAANVGLIRFDNVYTFECYGPDGQLKWADEIHNLVVNVGLDDVLDKYFEGSAYTAAHYIGLTDGTPTVAAADTMVTHAGWVEDQNYTEATRPLLDFSGDAVSGQSLSNAANKGVFSINATTTVGGAFINTVNTKGGTTGTLYGAGAFTQGDKPVDNGDTLNVTVTLTAAAA